ncbi:YPL107Wp protein [Saccharomyces cerevisiae]|nr:YPL107Wp protein [Saccharomyces boulardii (nom. inval.)]
MVEKNYSTGFRKAHGEKDQSVTKPISLDGRTGEVIVRKSTGKTKIRKGQTEEEYTQQLQHYFEVEQGLCGQRKNDHCFGGRLKGEPPRSTSRVLSGGTKKIAGVQVPAKPQEPDNCCMSGCVNCVWEIYSEDLRDWKHRRKEAAEKIAGTKEKWPKDWNPPLGLLHMENVPVELREKKLEIDSKKAEQPHDLSAIRSLFPKRKGPLPKSVLAAKRKNIALRHNYEQKDGGDQSVSESDADEGWEDIPVYVKAFAEFESKKRLQKIRRQEEIKKRTALV